MTSYMSQVIQIHIISYQEYHNSSSLRDSRFFTRPISYYPRRLPPKWKEKIHEEIKLLEATGVVVASQSPHQTSVQTKRRGQNVHAWTIDS